MKKVIASALGLMLGGTLIATTAHAEIENQFGGYWRTRFSVQDNMSKYPGDTKFMVDTRSRIYYTAKFNENLKFVNKFEFNTTWGDSNYGKIGADGKKDFRIKNSYVQADFGNVTTKVGAFAAVFHRGLLFDDDFIGVLGSPKFGNVTPVFIWGRAKDKDFGGQDYNMDFFHGAVKVAIGETVTIGAGLTGVVGSNETVDVKDDLVVGIGQPLASTVTGQKDVGDINYVFAGIDVDVNLDPVKGWGTFVYQTGDKGGIDVDAFALAVGADAGVAHGAFYYATGDDGSDATESTAFAPISPYVVTAEIMGAGSTIDGTFGPASLRWGFSDIMIFNAGATLKPMENVTLKFDGFYGALAEDNTAGNTEIGWEGDAKATIKLLENLKADIFFAYLIAGDATNDAAGNDDDVMEGGARLSLSF